MLTGNIFITTDFTVVMNQCAMNDPNTRIVYIDNVDPKYENILLNGTLLMPPYEAISARLEGDMQTYNITYNNYLASDFIIAYLAIFVKLLYSGTNIILYMSKDSYEMYYKTLYDFILFNFGISIGDEQTPPTFNTNYIPQICNLLYLNDVYFTFEEYMKWYPLTQIPDDVIRKMITQVNPFSINCDGTFEWYKKYFEDYKAQVLQTGNVLKIVAKRVD